MRNKFYLFLAFTLLTSMVRADPYFSRFETIPAIQKELEKENQDQPSRRKAALHSDLGTLYYRSGKNVEAAAEFEKALTQPTTMALKRHIYAYMGKCYEALGRWDKAIEAYEYAAHYEPKYWRRHRDLAAMYRRVQLYDKAIESYDKALKLQPRKPELYFARGEVWIKMLFYEKAEESLRHAHEYGMDNVDWKRAMSHVLEKQGRFGEALPYEIQTVGPSSPVADQGRLLYIALLAGETSLAQRTFNQMKQIKDAQGSLNFYQDVLKSFTDSPAQVLTVPFKDPTLKALVLTEEQ